MVLEKTSIFAAFLRQFSPGEILAKVYEASANNVNYKYHEPKENNEGKIKGVMYEKFDKKIGDMK